MQNNVNVLRGFSLGRLTQTAGTAITAIIPPYNGPVGTSPFNYSALSGRANWLEAPNFGVTHITDISVLCGATEHTFYILRPLNWTTITEAVTKNDTTFKVAANPGTYSSYFRYPTIGGPANLAASGGVAMGGAAPTLAADNTAAGSDYVAWQYDDGSWGYDTIASVSGLTLTLTTGTPNRDGCTVAVGKPLFFFGVAADLNPITGQAHAGFDTIASSRNIWQSSNGLGIVTALHPGDPMILVDANATNADIFNIVSGFYAQQ